LLVFGIVLVLICDRLTKFIVPLCLEPGQSVPLIGKAILLTYIRNTGTAFGLFREHAFVFVIISSVVIAILLWFALVRPCLLGISPSGDGATAVGLIIGGAIGNFIDRLIFGYVIDFVDFQVWPVFNAADAGIVLGAIVMGWRLIFRK
jgi:signal peptidase II